MLTDGAGRPGLRRVTGMGLVGSAITALGAYAYASMPRTDLPGSSASLQLLRQWPYAHAAGAAVCLLGLLVLTGAWLLLGAQVRAGSVGAGAVKRAALLWALPLMFAPPLFSGDAWSYAADAFLTGHGASPYLVTPHVLHGPIVEAVCTCWRGTPAPYGPVPLVWGALFSQVWANPWFLLLAYRLLALIGLGILMFAVPRLVRIAGREPVPALWLTVASPFVLASGIGGAHLDLVMVSLVALALALTPSRGWVVGALVVGVATSVKAPAVVADLGVVLLTTAPGTSSRLRRAAQVAGVTVATVVAIGAFTDLGLGWIRTIRVVEVLHTPLSLSYELARVLHQAGGHDARMVADATGMAVLLLVGLVLFLRARARPDVAVAVAGLALLLTTVLSPAANYWYFLWGLPLLACSRLPAWAGRCAFALVLDLGLVEVLDPSVKLPYGGFVELGVTVAGLVVALFWEKLVAVVRASAYGRARVSDVLDHG